MRRDNSKESVMSVNTRGIRPAQAAEKLGIGVSTLWARAKREPDFPKPVKLSTRTTIFVERELDDSDERGQRDIQTEV
jgi:prophage regulatory protein